MERQSGGQAEVKDMKSQSVLAASRRGVQILEVLGFSQGWGAPQMHRMSGRES